MRRKLDPDLALKVPWSREEDELLLRLQEVHDNHWAEMAKSMQGRNAQMCRTRCLPLRAHALLAVWGVRQLLSALTRHCLSACQGLHTQMCWTRSVLTTL